MQQFVEILNDNNNDKDNDNDNNNYSDNDNYNYMKNIYILRGGFGWWFFRDFLKYKSLD